MRYRVFDELNCFIAVGELVEGQPRNGWEPFGYNFDAGTIDNNRYLIAEPDDTEISLMVTDHLIPDRTA